MVLAFLLVLWQRDRIRAHWWVHRLQQVEAMDDQVYYIIRLVSVGDVGAGAIRRLAADSRGEVAGLAVVAATGLSAAQRFELLEGLLVHSDEEVRHSAARQLAFTEDAQARALLIAASGSENALAAAAALAGLARVANADAVDAIRKAMVSHASPLARAQAAESLGQHIRAIAGDLSSRQAASRPSVDCVMVEALTAALADVGSFTGQLALERELAAVSAAVAAREGTSVETSGPASVATADAPRTVGDVAAAVLSDLTGHTITPRRDMDAEALLALAQSCCVWIAEREFPQMPLDALPSEAP